LNDKLTSSIVLRVVDAIKNVAGSAPVGLHEPYFKGNEKKYLNECIDSTFVSSVGKFVDRFEAELASYTGAKYAVAVVNGTAALHVSLLLAGVQQGDEVLIPALTFIATANAVSYCEAQPHFVESEITTLGMDPEALRIYLNSISEIRNERCVNLKTGNVIRAIVPMHTFGHPVDIEGLLGVAKDFHLVLIEDAAESLGSTVNGRHTGTFGTMGTLSFNGNKSITTGGGGAILTDDPEIAKKAKHISTTAKISHRWEYEHDEIGYNYRLPNLNAALGCAQLEQLPSFINAKRRLYERYKEEFTKVPNTKIIAEPKNCRSNYWLQTLLLDESIESERNAILTATNDAGFMTRPVWKLINQLKPYQNCQSMKLPIAESLSRRLINLPSSPQIIMKNSV
jgi:perosamine synthetase